MAHMNITNGPSKWELMQCLFEATCEHPRSFQLDIEDPADGNKQWMTRVCVTQLTRVNDYSSDDFLFEGFVSWAVYAKGGHPQIRGQFSTKTRKGWYEGKVPRGICSRCQTQLSDDDVTCRHCGSVIILSVGIP